MQIHMKRRPRPRLAVHVNRPAMQAHAFLDDVQPDARALDVAHIGAAVKTLEQTGQVGRPARRSSTSSTALRPNSSRSLCRLVKSTSTTALWQ